MEKLLNTLKQTLVTVNFFYVISGVILLYLGISVKVEIDKFWHIWWGYHVPLYYVGVGTFMLLVATLGFYGAIKENHLISVAYAGAMVLTFILQLSGCIAGYVTKDYSLGVLQNALTSLPEYYHNFWAEGQWAVIQEQFQCCGNVNASEWVPLLKTEETLQVPVSCCPRLNVFHQPSVCTIDNAYTRGCGEVFMNFANSLFNSIWIGGAFLALMQGLIVASVVNALRMVKAARKDKENYSFRYQKNNFQDSLPNATQ